MAGVWPNDANERNIATMARVKSFISFCFLRLKIVYELINAAVFVRLGKYDVDVR
jgi:hypothetical protein